jgi:hypothetical protein
LTWNDEAERLGKELAREKWNGERETSLKGRKWIIVKKQILADIECVKCQGAVKTFNKIVEEDGKNNLKWLYLQRKVN